MGAVKKAFKKIGQGIKTVAKGIGGNIKGLVKMAGGALTFNPRLLKEGAKSYANGMKNIVSGAGQVAGGMAAASVGMSPLGAAINGLTGGAASRLACKTFTSAAETVTNGVEGAFKMADGLVHGDMKKVLSGALAAGELASMAIPGAGAAAFAAKSVTKSVVKDQLKDEVLQAAMSKLPMNGIRC